MDELEKIRNRYSRRKLNQSHLLYNPLNPSVYMNVQEKEQKIIKILGENSFADTNSQKVLEIGCGSGTNLLLFLKLGFLPENLVGNELLEERAEYARKILPPSTQILVGDASQLNLPDEYFDIVYQSTVFTSILDYQFKRQLAERMWNLTKPGGGILWYDFIYNNPKNPDVKGISIKEIKQLFPEGEIEFWRVTLAPFISRKVTRIHPALYSVFNTLPFLRTHVLCWIKKTK
ncbi:class I SAM-dependent methyltransferase [Brevibacillus sp. SYSU BS000544]|uniref:class I SAM-dependent methyltransferase n=1 Tax=Brevibacillus sp. SYSU BS000544 TaxID=3416443 RepID=UPI003CE45291